ncbi:hypothetical protein [Thalassotalea fusca]
MVNHKQQTNNATTSLFQVMLLLLFLLTILSSSIALSAQLQPNVFSDESSALASSHYVSVISFNDVGRGKHQESSQTPIKIFKSSDNPTPFDIDTHTVLSRASAMCFQAEPQVQPDYFLEMEFFPIGLLSASFAKLANPDKSVKWFETQQSSKSSARLSLWKDSNQIYTHQISALS